VTRASVVIPVFNRAALTRQCLDALFRHTPVVDFEVIVVDDASTDATPNMLRTYQDQIRVVRHDANMGFATACNDGAVEATGEFIVFLNNDTIPKAEWLDALVRYADDHPKAAVVGSKLLFPNDTIQHAGVVICQDRYPRHIYTGFPAQHQAVSRSRRFQVVTAASFLIRRAALDLARGFDTTYLNGYEDVDLCLRLGELGYEIHYCHESEAYHLESVSDGRLNNVDRNTRLYVERWSDRVRPDDLAFYAEDGLLRVDYSQSYPLTFHVAPLLGSGRGGDGDDPAHRLIAARSRQVFDLLRDNVLLNVRVREAELGHSMEPRNGTLDPNQGGGPSGRGRGAGRTRGTLHHARLVSRGEVHWQSSEPTDRLISVIVPVKNAAAQLQRLLPRILEQETRDRIEIIAVDSGSSDASVTVLQEHGATILAIDSEAFNHGATRNAAAGYARGEILIFVNQTTLPRDKRWLSALIAPFAADPRIAGICSRVLPHPGADPLTRFDGMRDPSGSADRQQRSISDIDEYGRLAGHQLRILINFHTVSAAIRADIFRLIPFREVLMGEDIFWAKDALEAGYIIQHEPASVVWHSHNYSIFEVLQRNVDDGMAKRQIVGRRIAVERIEPMIASMAAADWEYLERDAELKGADLQEWRVRSVLRRTAQAVGQWIGTNGDRLPGEIVERLSLTETMKRDGRTRVIPTTGD